MKVVKGIYVREANGSISHELDQYSKLSMSLRRNDVSSWSIECPITVPSTVLANQGMGILIEFDEDVFSGPVTYFNRQWDETNNNIVISGVSDDTYLFERVCYPCLPNGTPPTLFSADDYDARSGVAETVMHAYVSANMKTGGTFASGSNASRAISTLSFASDLGRGASVSGNARFNVVGELLQKLALAGGDLSFGISNNTFWVDEIADKSDEIIFGSEVGNLINYSYELTAPTATHFVVAGGGELTARTFVLGGDNTAASGWRRIESFRDRRDTTDTTELTQTLNEEITNGAIKTGLKIRPIDIPHMTYGVDYQLGDLVTAIVDGVEIQDVVREVEITVDGSGVVIAPSINSATSNGAPGVLAIFDRLRQLEQQVRDLQRVV